MHQPNARGKMIGALLGTLLCVCGCQAQTTTPVPASVTVVRETSTRLLNPALFGTNLQWEHRGDGLLEQPGAQPEFHSAAIDRIRAAGITSLRFPGGSLSNTYEWWSSVGPLERRSTGRSFAGDEIPSLFGTDELLALSALLDIPPVLTVNFTWPYDRAVDWINYVNRTGATTAYPPAQYWEIGNEVYSPDENGFTTAEDYAIRTNRFATEMKGADPSIKLGAIAEASFLQAAWMKDVFPHLLTWNESVIRNLSDDVDFLSLHFYAPFDKLPNDQALSNVVLAGPLAFRKNVELIRELLRRHDREEIELAVTEYSTFFGDTLVLDDRTAQPEGALFLGLMLFEMANHDDIVLANHWSLANNSVFGLLEFDTANEVIARPALDVFEALAAQAGNRLARASISSPSYSVQAIGNIPSMEVPLLDVLVTEDNDGRRYLNLINRSSTTPLEVSVNDGGSESRPTNFRQWHGTDTATWIQNYTASTFDLDNTDQMISLPPFSFTILTVEREP